MIQDFSIEISGELATIISYGVMALLVVTFILGFYVYITRIIFRLIDKAFSSTRVWKECFAWGYYRKEFSEWLKDNDKHEIIRQLNERQSKKS